MNVGERLKELRELKGISVNKLSNLAGLSQSFVREIELSKKNPTVDSLAYLCEALGISLHDFFDETLVGSIRNDSVLRAVYRLKTHQKEELIGFLDSMQE